MIARLPRPHTKKSDCIDANTPDGRARQCASGLSGMDAFRAHSGRIGRWVERRTESISDYSGGQ